MQGNETNQTPIEAITGTLQSHQIPCEALPSVAFTHPIEYFRLQCLKMANTEEQLSKNPEQIVKDAKIFADFLFLANGGQTPKPKPYIVGERGFEMQSSPLPPGDIEPLFVSPEEKRLHTLQNLFDDIYPNPDSICNLEAIHYQITMRLFLAAKNLKEAQEEVATARKEVDNLALDIIHHGNTDFLLKQGQSLPVRDTLRRDCKRARLWQRKAEETAVS